MTQYCTLDEAYSNYSISQRKSKNMHQKQAPENFQNAAEKTYSSQKTDYDYICKTTGVCVYPDKFQNGEKPPVKSCEPLVPPKYEYPFTDEEKARFKQALKIALEEMNSSPPPQEQPLSASKDIPTLPKAYETPKIDMTTINGYIDEELESYMMVNDMKSSVPYNDKVNKPVEVSPSDNEKQMITTPVILAPTRTENFTKKYRILFDLLLFTVSGILIILLLEQLFKLAVIAGANKQIDKIIEEKITAVLMSKALVVK